MSDSLTVDTVVKVYIALRDKKAALKAECDAQVEAINAKLMKTEAWIKEKADAQGVTSFKTLHGTAFLTSVDFASVGDWDAIVNFVVANGAYDMFERRISKKAVRAWIDNTKTVPPGVTYGTRLEVGVRKPTNKGEL